VKKIAFQASLPVQTFKDKSDFMHRVLQPMVTAMREQFNEQGDVRGYIRVSIMLDDVPAEAEDAVATIEGAGFVPVSH
jgi:hypothetical protein